MLKDAQVLREPESCYYTLFFFVRIRKAVLVLRYVIESLRSVKACFNFKFCVNSSKIFCIY